MVGIQGGVVALVGLKIIIFENYFSYRTFHRILMQFIKHYLK